MNVAWLVFDSVSFDATPFAPDGPNVMPKLKNLAEDEATIFTECYTPGQASPSSHSAFFTGRYPSETGMHELHPEYDGAYPTIADAVSKTHKSLLVSVNPFLSRGLDHGFNRFNDLTERHMVFEEASDPIDDSYQSGSRFGTYARFLLEGGKPLRSLVNGLAWKFGDASDDGYTAVPVIEVINDEIRNFRDGTDSETLVVANYMEAHAPFDPPREAIEQVVGDQPPEELPVRKSGQVTREEYLSDPEYDASDMYTLYLASIWDLDRRVTPLIEDLLADDTVVIVTADHGNWFRIDDSLEEDRIHVPLLIFTPETDGEYVDHTVNLRHIAATTTTLLRKESSDVSSLPGTNLLDVDSDLTSVTEFIDHKKIGDLSGHPVLPEGMDDESDGYYYYVSAIRGDSKINYSEGEESYDVIRGGGAELERLRSDLEEHVDKDVNLGSASRIEFNNGTEDRLRQLGYLE